MRDASASAMFGVDLSLSVQALAPNSEIIIMLVKDTKRSGRLCI